MEKNRIIGFLLLSISLVFFVNGSFKLYERYRTSDIKQIDLTVKTADRINPIPIRLSIDSVNIDSSITTTKDDWIYPADSLVYLQNTALPGNTGNAVIYGHNFKSLLGDLNKTTLGDTIKVELANGKVLNYRITNKYNVTSDQTHILNQTKDSRLTLFTCSGFLDSKRLVVIAKEVNL